MKKYTMKQKKEMVEKLREQDRLLEKIYEEREAIGKEVRENGIYDKIWDMLMSDGKSHWTF